MNFTGWTILYWRASSQHGRKENQTALVKNVLLYSPKEIVKTSGTTLLAFLTVQLGFQSQWFCARKVFPDCYIPRDLTSAYVMIPLCSVRITGS